jgi:hypothetical protein
MAFATSNQMKKVENELYEARRTKFEVSKVEEFHQKNSIFDQLILQG